MNRSNALTEFTSLGFDGEPYEFNHLFFDNLLILIYKHSSGAGGIKCNRAFRIRCGACNSRSRTSGFRRQKEQGISERTIVRDKA
jgi:hypothetical protein